MPLANPQQQIDKLRELHMRLSEISQQNLSKIQVQKSIYLDFVKIFSKFSTKITDLSKRINEEILSPSLSTNNSQQESMIHHFQFLSNSLLKLGECSKGIATAERHEILDPMKIFLNNYKSVSDELLEKILSDVLKMHEINLELTKNRESYYAVCEKFEKQRQMQNKAISKIESGDKLELEKLNAQIKKLTNSVTSNEEQYRENVTKANQQWKATQKAIAQVTTSFSNNEETRSTFAKRSVLSTLKMLQTLQQGYISNVESKLKETSKIQKEDDHLNAHYDSKVRQVIQDLNQTEDFDTFVSFEDHTRKKKRIDAIQQEHLQEVFRDIKSQDKYKIKEFVEQWFIEEKPHESQNQQKANDASGISVSSKQSEESKVSKSLTDLTSLDNSPVNQKQISTPSSRSKKSVHLLGEEQHLDDVKGKVIESLPYSFYFVEELYNQIVAMPSFYCKLEDQSFYYLLNVFNVTTKSLEIKPEISQNDLSSEFIYKMMYISQRIFWKRNHQNKDRPIELLCNHYSKNIKFFNDKKILELVYGHLLKKKQIKRKPSDSNKNMLTSFTKNIFSRKKEKPALSSEDQFNCLQEITNLMANFNVSDEVSLSLIKDLIAFSGQSNQSSTFDYLKGMILKKKDVQSRRKIFFKTEIKQKRQKRIQCVIQNKQLPEFCLKITAKSGFLGRQQLVVRLVCKYLKNSHCDILSHLRIPPTRKWVQLVPYNRQVDYISMKQEVAEKSVPSATEEIITLDVNRSLHIHGEYLNPTILHTLLRTYAFFHKEISYCQGMNYIAGYLYLKTLNEESAYRVFEHMMEVRFKELFADEFEVLKIKMYQFERLLAIFHPEVSEHFKRQSVSPECYIVSWIITLFASSYQYTMQSYLIDKLWERFIIWGWKEFFKFILWLFDLKKEQLIELTYDKALHSLGEIARSKLILASNEEFQKLFPDIEDMDTGVNRFEVTQELLDSILAEYKLLKQ